MRRALSLDSNETSFKMQLISISPPIGFDLTDRAFGYPITNENDWRAHMPRSLIALWGEMNNYERHVAALVAYANRTPKVFFDG
jgi:hypothetical protein